ncbi:glyoxalase [Luteibacter sp. 3190]|uniref:VOC family protein n=1 Tax=Luteibacter sp. 3190 TaxID=2817736 RepID=UPI0028543C1F|nr:glyoxalase [Luteibacter sp. 3190]MDR6935980.1 putative enzyme related to lactoylglutathione lyase [Luteibacter sp. 3190]
MRPTFLIASLALLASSASLASTPDYAVGAQYDTTHVYVAPSDVDAFVRSFTATFGGRSTPQVVVTVTPTSSSTSSQLVQTPVGSVSVFGFRTPVPYPFGLERTGYLVTDVDAAVKAANAAGAATLVAPFDDPIGRDAIVAWPGGVNMQLYWHTKKPVYAALEHVPENRIYLPAESADAFVGAFVRFAHGKVVSDVRDAPGSELGRSGTYRRIRIASGYGKATVLVTDGHLDWPYGTEVTGYEVSDLDATLARARASGAKVVVDAHAEGDRRAAMLQFPGGHVAEVHSEK